ncbi:GntR family transcriptional regulator [Pseudooceanicola sp. 216_PA32_1]|uniref:GntR family transcriptional regulator n=1 Tax=Pseudooceanicola pacificus TaxID=2676438 RepID=A0A844W258_9RHOB|nr:GntR family transcriptional regulator [Pseudooceanicola pacificus]MWB78226.1 GntR family transcriptional regulator [Pseudooceanicola pacificus]
MTEQTDKTKEHPGPSAPDLCDTLLARMAVERANNPRETKRSALRQAFLSVFRDQLVGPGDRLPSESELAQRLSVSLGTVQSALGQLQDSGLIVRRRGDGTRVADADTMSPQIWHFRFRVAKTNRSLRITDTKVEILRTNETGSWSTHLGEGDHTLIRRRISGDGVKLGAEMYLPPDLFQIDDIELSELQGVNLRTYLEAQLGQRARLVTTQVSFVVLPLRQAAMFDMRPDSTAFKVEARTVLADGRPFYHQTIYAHADDVVLEF